MKAQEIVDYTKSLDCVHCGLCLRSCPTYMATGIESRSPRGRIHIMRSLAEDSVGVDATLIDELDSCLLCRACESVCPSGVQYTQLLEQAREALADHEQRPWLGRQLLRLGLRRVLPSRYAVACMAGLLEFGQCSGLLKLFAALAGPLGRASLCLPRIPNRRERLPLDKRYAAKGQLLARVAMLEGCVMPAFFGRVNRATASVLQSCGREVHVPRTSTCCGALHAHNGDLEMARSLAKQTIVAFEELEFEDAENAALVVNSAGCSAQMKEYGELLQNDAEFAARAKAFSARVRDFSEYLADEALPEFEQALAQESKPVNEPLAFDDPCHLCHAQGIRSQPRTLLDRLGLQRVELRESESCCGSAGLYATLRPDDSQQVLQLKLDALRESGARTLVTANPGCHLQWQAGVQAVQLDVEVLHIAELLERSLDWT